MAGQTGGDGREAARPRKADPTLRIPDRSDWRKPVLLSLLMAVSATHGQALKTDGVDFGLNGAYDGQVRVERNAAGQLTFRDTEVTSVVSLTSLTQSSGSSHSGLLGLDGDDHTQYLNTVRHLTTHDADFNSTLTVPADVDGNTTLGAHLADGDIHPNRTTDTTVTGAWDFEATLEATTITAVSIATGDLRTTTPTADHDWRGLVVSMTVGTTVTFGQLLYCDGADGQLKLCDADTTATMPALALALESKTVGQSCKVLLHGFVRDDSLSLTPGKWIFPSTTAGALSTTHPTGDGDQIQGLGYALTSTSVLFQPDMATYTYSP